MRVLLSLCLTSAVVCAAAAAAHADGLYVSESFGGTDVKDELASSMGSALRLRFAAGYRHKNWAIEGWLGGSFGLTGDGHHGGAPYPDSPTTCGGKGCGGGGGGSGYYDGTSYSSPSSLFTYGVDVKYLRPVARHVELYLRGGLSRGVLDDGDYAGRGLGLGAGVQIKGRVPALGFLFWPLFFTGWGPKVTAAAFIDDGFEFYRLHRGGVDGAGAIDARLNHLTIGFAVGSDF